MSMDYKKLFHYLIDDNIKESDLRKRANISAPTLSKLKKGETVTTEVLGRICNALGCSPDNIMEYERELKIGQIYETYCDECDYGIVIKVINTEKHQVYIFPLYPYSNIAIPHVRLYSSDTNLPHDVMAKCDHSFKVTIHDSAKYYATASLDCLKQMTDCIVKQKALIKDLDNLIEIPETGFTFDAPEENLN